MRHHNRIAIIAGIVLLAGLGILRSPSALQDESTASFIVQGKSLDAVKSLVAIHGGELTHELGVISAVAADLTAGQVADLRSHRDVRRVYGNETVEVAAKGGKSSSGTNSS
ncbi:MAG: hypothetical protein OEQ14_07915, partial [Gammaproteobacteria bacterium]|nr:hypothetical protein [Gammaproteobacteria bacterium]